MYMTDSTQINCPKCGTSIDINKALYIQLETEIKNKFDTEVQTHRQKYQQAVEVLKQKELRLKQQEDLVEEKIQKELHARLTQEKGQLMFTIKEELEELKKYS